MRLCTTSLLCLLVLAIAGAAPAADMGMVAVEATPQVVFTRQAGVILRQEATVPLQVGSNRFTFDFGRYDVDPATVDLRVLAPSAGVQVVSREIMARQPGQVVFALEARQAVQARLSLSYALKGLESEVVYTALLAPQQQTMTLEAQVTLRNNSKQSLPQVQITPPAGHRLTTALALGQSVQQTLFRFEGVPYQVVYLYDNSRFKDSVRALVRVARDGATEFEKLSLPAGKLRAFTPTAGSLPSFVAEAALKYSPAHESVELDLGVVPEITVLRTKLRGDQVNVRTDVYRKLAMFDLEEEWELAIENHRTGPATVLFDEHIPGEWQMVKASALNEKQDAGGTEFVLKLAPGEKTKLNYVVRRLNVEP